VQRWRVQGCRENECQEHQLLVRGSSQAGHPVGARAYDVTAVLTFSAAAARGALARGVCLDELSTKHSIRPDF
jgi:hypothetical protein